MLADLEDDLARCTEDDLDLLVALQRLNDESVETDEPLVWSKLELVGFVNVQRSEDGPPPLVVLTPRGRAACRAARRSRDAG